MGTRHSREAILAAAVSVLARRGVGGLSFASVGAELDIPDRTVVYYFPTKVELLQASVRSVSESLRELLLVAFGTEPSTADALLARAWPVMTSPEALPWMRVYLELVGRAAAGDEVHRALAAEITTAWIGWLAQLVEGASEEERHAGAASIVAAVDGHLILATLGIPSHPSAGSD